ncbi:FIG001587: exported protein (plasmid) [Klebsiella aerogenes]|nr:FIG001587: exported protein [Klebsiella aerogenes]
MISARTKLSLLTQDCSISFTACRDYSGTNKPVQLISGYRSVDTNDELRARSRGVAKHSYHTKGQAMDFHIEGVALSNIRKAALSMRSGGVGYYPRSNFVHIDTGPVRHW